MKGRVWCDPKVSKMSKRSQFSTNPLWLWYWQLILPHSSLFKLCGFVLQQPVRTKKKKKTTDQDKWKQGEEKLLLFQGGPSHRKTLCLLKMKLMELCTWIEISQFGVSCRNEALTDCEFSRSNPKTVTVKLWPLLMRGVTHSDRESNIKSYSVDVYVQTGTRLHSYRGEFSLLLIKRNKLKYADHTIRC